MTVSILAAVLLAVCVTAAPSNYDERETLRELVDLLEKQVEHHKRENQLLSEDYII